MKQVTIENVKARIAQIENAASVMLPAGLGLSLKHEFELACLRALLGMMQTVQVLPSGWRMVPTEPQPTHEYPETLPCSVLLEPGMRFGKGVKTRLVLDAIQRRAEHYAELEAMTPQERAEYEAGIEAFKAMLQQPAPVVPDELKEAAADFLTVLDEYPEQLVPINRDSAVVRALRAAMLHGAEPSPATDNTAQQFEALATSAQPEIIGYEHRLICGELRRVPKFAGEDISRKGCEWDCDDVGTWHGKCGAEWQFFEDGPDENGMKFCPGCGQPVSTASAGSGKP